MLQLILHLLGDYVLQSDWMAQNKTKATWPAVCHAFVYSLPFMFIADNRAWMVIYFSHFFIDRFRLARFVVFAKNRVLAPSCWVGFLSVYNTPAEVLAEWTKWRWRNCSTTGYPSETPAWLAVWLMIVADNTLHLAINYFSIRYL